MELLDTHVFLDLALKRDSPRRARPPSGAEVALSAISAGEIAWLARKGILRIGRGDVESWYFTAIHRMRARVLDVTDRVWLRAVCLEWEHRDLADRVLVQTAIDEPGATLWTRDATILEFAGRLGLPVQDCR